MSAARTKQKVILFTCNWHPFSSLDAVGRQGLSHSTAIIPVRLPCLGRISPGIILKAYEGGAAGVCLLGCPEHQCHYQTGNQQAREVFLETRQLIKLLGYNEDTLQYHLIQAEDGQRYLEIIEQMLDAVKNGRGNR
jgi:F420-non-reducing hydrogenase iron-sulfur subunit